MEREGGKCGRLALVFVREENKNFGVLKRDWPSEKQAKGTIHYTARYFAFPIFSIYCHTNFLNSITNKIIYNFKKFPFHHYQQNNLKIPIFFSYSFFYFHDITLFFFFFFFLKNFRNVQITD